MTNHIEEIEKWVDVRGHLSGNFTRSSKVDELKNFLIYNTEFLDNSVGFAIRYGYVKRGITVANKCLKCNGNITKYSVDVKYCCKDCANTSNEKCQKISNAKRTRDKKSPYKEMTLEWWQWKYGKEDGEKRYLERNSKVKITLETLTMRYGIEEGNRRYEEYKHNISYSSTLEYYIKKYGNDGIQKHTDLLKKKSRSLENFIRCYGEDEGKIKFDSYINKLEKNNHYSKISQELFWNIYNKLDIKEKIYFAELNKEFNRFFRDRIYFYDFVDSNRKKVIEFNGDMWHANPYIFTENELVNPFNGKLAKEIWLEDKIKIDAIKSLGYTVLIIWEMDYKKNPNLILNNCLSFIKEKVTYENKRNEIRFIEK